MFRQKILLLLLLPSSLAVPSPAAAAPATDNTAAVQALIDAGKPIPAGTFHVTRLHGGSVRGSGRDRTILKELAAGGSYVAMVRMADHAVVSDLTLDDVGGVALGGGMNSPPSSA